MKYHVSVVKSRHARVSAPNAKCRTAVQQTECRDRERFIPFSIRSLAARERRLTRLSYLVHHTCYSSGGDIGHSGGPVSPPDLFSLLSYISRACVSECDCPPPPPRLAFERPKCRPTDFSTRFTIACKKVKPTAPIEPASPRWVTTSSSLLEPSW